MNRDQLWSLQSVLILSGWFSGAKIVSNCSRKSSSFSFCTAFTCISVIVCICFGEYGRAHNGEFDSYKAFPYGFLF